MSTHYAFTIDGVPPSMNDIMRMPVRRPKHLYHETRQAQASDWYARVKYAALAADAIPPEPLQRATVHLAYRFPDAGRRDPDNYAGKWLLDGMVHAGILADDSFANVNLFILCRPPVEGGQVEVSVWEMEMRP